MADMETLSPWWKDATLRRLNLIILGIITVQITAGYDQVVVGSFLAMEPWFAIPLGNGVKDMSDNHARVDAMANPNPSRIGLITTATFIGALLGSIPASICTDRYGRKAGLLIGSLSTLAGSVVQASAYSYAQFTVGRAMLGFGLSFNGVAAPSLIAELAHPRQRGAVLGFFNNLWYVGSLVAAWTSFGTGRLSSQWSWRAPSILQVMPSVVLLAILPFVPESPRYLFARGREEEAIGILAEYHANGVRGEQIILEQVDEIRHAVGTEAMASKKGWSVLWSTRANLHRTLCAVSVGFLTIWSGQAIISYYFSPILTQVGIIGTTQQTGINAGMQVWNLGISILGAILVEAKGRRPLWLTSFVVMICGNIGVLVSSSIASMDTSNHAAAYLVIFFLFLYNGGFNVGCNPLTYAYPAEILPYEIRTKGLALYIFVAYSLATLNIYVNPIAIAHIGWRYWAVYLFLLFVWLAVIYFTYPETKGLTLEGSSQLFEARRSSGNHDAESPGQAEAAGVGGATSSSEQHAQKRPWQRLSRGMS